MVQFETLESRNLFSVSVDAAPGAVAEPPAVHVAPAPRLLLGVWVGRSQSFVATPNEPVVTRGWVLRVTEQIGSRIAGTIELRSEPNEINGQFRFLGEVTRLGVVNLWAVGRMASPANDPVAPNQPATLRMQAWFDRAEPGVLVGRYMLAIGSNTSRVPVFVERGSVKLERVFTALNNPSPIASILPAANTAPDRVFASLDNHNAS